MMRQYQDLRRLIPQFNQFNQSMHYIPSGMNAKGLENKFGQNNCFLNVVIQALWQISSFRNKFNSWNNHTHKNDQNEKNCVFCALKTVFTQYQYAETPLIPPTTLREALHQTFAKEARFQLGEMDDAAETLEAILNCLQEVGEEGDGVPRQVFGIDTEKTVYCPKCNTTSSPDITCNFIEYTYFSPLKGLKEVEPKFVFEDLVRVVGQEWKSCPREDKSIRPLCEEKIIVKRKLLNVPEVLAIGIVWETTQPSVQEIMSSLALIPNNITINKIFSLDFAPVLFRFRGMICYYGKHYACYFFDEKLAKWIVFDDATVKVVGDWHDVLTRARLGHFHPSVLLFERNPGSVIPPRVKVVIPEPVMNNNVPDPIAQLRNSLQDLRLNLPSAPIISQSTSPSTKKGYSVVNIQKKNTNSTPVKKGYSRIN